MRPRVGVVLVGRDLDDGTIWKRAVGVGAEHVALLPAAESWLIARLADAVDECAALGLTVAVIGGRGGAGASTLAAALAVTAMRGGRRVMLVDADPHGGGADLLFGGEHAAGLRWSDIAGANGRIEGEELRAALPHFGELAVLSYDRGDPLDLRTDAVSSVLAAAARVCDLTVADLPRRIDDAAGIVLAAADVVLLVVPAEVRAVASAARVATEITRVAHDVRVVVRGPAPGGLAALDVAHALGLPSAGYLKAEPGLGAALERGEAPAGQGRGPLATFCRELLASLPFSDDRDRDPMADFRVDSIGSIGSDRRPRWRCRPRCRLASDGCAMTLDHALVARVRSRLADDVTPPTTARVAALVREEAGVRGAAQVLAAVETLRSELVGAGPLEALLHEPGVTDVLVNGPDEVWVDRGRGLERADVRFGSDREIRRLAARLAAAAGRRLDDAVPYADIRLADGVRLHAVLPPVSPGGVCLSFRVPRRRAFSLDEFVDMGAMSREAAALLAAVVASRASFVVTGGTGTGKTTLLATLLGRVDPRERVVIVEDSGELRPDHPHVVRLEARAPNIEGAGAIELRSLVRHALRMRPDRLVVGEVRGAECVDLLAALNVGHDGGAGTLHANSVVDVPARIEALCTAAGLSREAAHSQLGAGLRVVVHLARGLDGQRVLDSVGVVVRQANGLVEVQPAMHRRSGRWVDAGGRVALDQVLDA